MTAYDPGTCTQEELRDAIPLIEKVWIPALRSGDYKQGKGRLRDSKDRFCCLGVACDLIDPNAWDQYTGCEWRCTVPGHGTYVASCALPPALPLGHVLCTKITPDDKIWKAAGYAGLRHPTDTSIQGLCIALNDAGQSFEFIADFLETYALPALKEKLS